MTKNKYIGVFGCRSSEYASTLFPFAKFLFSFKEGGDKDEMQIHRALYAVYSLIHYLITTKKFEDGKATSISNKGFQLIRQRKAERDRIILEKPYIKNIGFITNLIIR